MKTWLAGIAVLFCIGCRVMGEDAIPPVIIDYFYEPGCPECGRVSREVMPDLHARYEGFYQMRQHDTGVVSNVVRLIAYQNAVGVTRNSSVSMIIDYTNALCIFSVSPRMPPKVAARFLLCEVRQLSGNWLRNSLLL